MMRKPKVVILGTGGTIAGRAGSNTEMTGYQAGEIGIQTLINAVPEMLEVADVTGEQFCNIGSFDMIDDIWLRLSRRVSELLQQPEVDGIVITHGTDTLEEIAYFLNLTGGFSWRYASGNSDKCRWSCQSAECSCFSRFARGGW